MLPLFLYPLVSVPAHFEHWRPLRFAIKSFLFDSILIIVTSLKVLWLDDWLDVNNSPSSIEVEGTLGMETLEDDEELQKAKLLGQRSRGTKRFYRT